jgi:hypothetical protein
MTRLYNTFIAKETKSINCAVIFENIRYGVQLNRKRKKCFYRGLYWVFGSYEHYADYFDELTPRQIRTAIKKLEDLGFILSDTICEKNRIEKHHKKVKWYTVNPKSELYKKCLEDEKNEQLGIASYSEGDEDLEKDESDNETEKAPEAEETVSDTKTEAPTIVPQVVGMNHTYTVEPNVSCETVEAPNTNKNYAKQLFNAWNAIGGMNSGEIRFLTTFGATRGYLKGLHSDDVFKAIENYGKVKSANGWYKHNLSWESFVKKIEQFLPNNFKIENYVDGEDLKKIEEQREAEQKAEEQIKAEQEAEEQRKAWEAKSTEEKAFYQLRAEWMTNFFDKERVVELLEMWKSVETERSKNGYKTMIKNQKYGFEEKLPSDLWDGSFEEWKADFLGARKTEAEVKSFLEQSPMSMIADTLKKLRGDTEEEAPKAEPKEAPKEAPKEVEDDSMPVQKKDERYEDYVRRLGAWQMAKAGL